MKSIKVKIGVLVLVCVLMVSVVIGNVSMQSSKGVVEENSAKIMTLSCEKKAETINALLSRIEQSVITLSEHAVSAVGDVAQFQTDSEYVEQYSKQLENITLNAANNTEGAMTAYIRYNPEFTEPTSGLFFSRNSAESPFEKLVPTDFSIYDPDDTAHVGWYYIPVKNNAPTWLPPYVNENINAKMISYVIPITVDGVSIGIVGMDIDFQVLEDIVDDTMVYDSSYAFLTDANANILYHKDFEMNEPLESIENGQLSELAKELKESTSSDGLFSYRFGEDEKKMTFITLNNGMRFVFTAPTSEINQAANALIKKIVIISIIAFVVSLFISWLVIMGIVKPIQELNVAAGKIAKGDLDVTVTCRSKDEIGTLADSFRSTVERLHTYIDYINETSDVLYQIAGGNLSIQLKREYAGEFARIKEALYRISETLSNDIYQIKVAATQVSMGASQVSSGSQVLSMGSSEQAEAVRKLSDEVQEVAMRARSNRDSAQTARELTDNAGRELSECNEQMLNMIQAMQDISTNADEIINIIKTIDDIAMQTNILALNAAVEAARAGEAGKGFSIVAEEVKNLAAKSAEAAGTIGELVKNAVASIKGGSGIADKTGMTIVETLSGAKEVADIVERITVDSNEQAESTISVLKDVEKISEVIQQNSTTSQESAAASQELSAQAQMLTELVAKFKIKDSAIEKEI